MKVRVVLTVEVDPENWEAVYGVPIGEQRDDVRSYVVEQVRGSAASQEDCITEVTLAKDSGRALPAASPMPAKIPYHQANPGAYRGPFQ